MNAAEFTRLVKHGRVEAGRHEAAQRAAYMSCFQDFCARAMKVLREESYSLTAAAGEHSIPHEDSMYPLDANAAELEERTRGGRTLMVNAQARPILEAVGIQMEPVKNPLVNGALEKMGQHITAITEADRVEIMRLVADGHDLGMGIDDITQMVTYKMTGINSSRAARIARTELAAATNGSQHASALIAGVTAQKQWLAASDQFVRESHAEADGQEVGMTDYFDVGGSAMMYPGDPDGPPEEVVNCRCTLLYLDPDSEITASAGRSATVNKPRGIHTVTRQTITAAGGEQTTRVAWEGELMFIEKMTDDQRIFAADGAGWRTPPLPLMWMRQDSHGGFGDAVSSNVGQIDRLWIADVTLDTGETVSAVNGTGTFNETPEAAQAITDVESGDQTRVSVDASASKVELHILVSEEESKEEQELMDWIFEGEMPEGGEIILVEDSSTEYLRFLEWQVMGCTGVPFSAFPDSKVRLAGRDSETVTPPEPDASAAASTAQAGADGSAHVHLADGPPPPPPAADDGGDSGETPSGTVDEINGAVDELAAQYPGVDGKITATIDGTDHTATFPADDQSGDPAPPPAKSDGPPAKTATIEDVRAKLSERKGRAAIVASATPIPVDPPAEWFEREALTEATPITVTDDGQVYGHACLWDSCHLGQRAFCQRPPKSKTNYAFFHLGQVKTAEGHTLQTGKITLATGHAKPGLPTGDATTFYEDTGNAVVDCRVYEGPLGLEVRGAVRPWVSAEQLRELRGAQLSGDWRPEGRTGHELVALLCVNVPGFAVPAPQVSITAAAGNVVEVGSVTGVFFDTPTEKPKRSREVLRASMGGRQGLRDLIAAE